jgi:hypothetical protein
VKASGYCNFPDKNTKNFHVVILQCFTATIFLNDIKYNMKTSSCKSSGNLQVKRRRNEFTPKSVTSDGR